MPDVITDTSALSTVQTAYNRAVDFALRPELYFDAVANVRATAQDKPGNPVKFTLYDDLSANTTELTETSDIDVVGLSDSQVTVTLREYGNAVQVTAKLRGTTFVPNFEADVANLVGYNAGLSLDTLARSVLFGGSHVIRQAAQASITDSMTLRTLDIQTAVADLRGDNVQTLGGRYVGFIHPDQSVDLRRETGAAGWVDPVNYSDATRRWNGEVGTFEGVRFIEAPRCPVLADAGSGNVDVYQAVVVGDRALAKAYSEKVSAPTPQVVIGPVTDRLRRFMTVGWYWLGGYAIYRQAAVRRIETASALGANT